MLQEPIISIIIPVYDIQEHLRSALDSVLEQTFHQYEIICVNDCSPDDCQTILEEYAEKDNRFILVKNEVNLGAGSARNTGLEMARGEYVTFLDPDDKFFNQDSLKHLYDIAEKYGDDMVLGDTYAFEHDDQPESEMEPTHYTDLMQELRTSIVLEDCPDLVKVNSVWNRLYRRSFLEKHALRFTPPRYAEDMNFAFYASFYASSISLTPEPTLKYRMGRYFGSATVKKCIDALHNLASQYEFMKKFGNDALISSMERKIFKHISFSYQREFAAQAGPGIAIEMLRCYHSLIVGVAIPKEYKDSWLETYFQQIHREDYTAALSTLAKHDPDHSYFTVVPTYREPTRESWSRDKVETTYLAKEGISTELPLQLKPAVSHKPSFPGDSENPIISVVVPVYNTAEHLGECLDSILEQTFTNFEIICVNDCSPDDCSLILEEFAQKDSRIRIVNREVNGGLASARNSGIEVSKGEFIYLLDSDDLLYDYDSLLHLWEIAICFKSEITIGGTVKWKGSTDEIYFDNHKAYLTQELRNINCETFPAVMQSIIACNKLFRRDFLEQHGILYFDDDLRRFEDNGFSWKVFMYADKISITLKPTYLFRQPEDGDYFLSRIYPHVDYLFIAIQKMFRFLEAHPELAHRRGFAEAQYSVVLVMGVARHKEHHIPLQERNRLFSKFKEIWEQLPEDSFNKLWPEARQAFPLMQQGEYNKAWHVFANRMFAPVPEEKVLLRPHAERYHTNDRTLPNRVEFRLRRIVEHQLDLKFSNREMRTLNTMFAKPVWRSVNVLRRFLLKFDIILPLADTAYFNSQKLREIESNQKAQLKRAVPLNEFGRARRLFINRVLRFVHSPLCGEINYLEKGNAIDPVYYWKRYPAAMYTGLSAAAHYVLHGAEKGFNPAPDFVTTQYIAKDPEAARRGINPYVHYLKSRETTENSDR
jgi:glycosyltransferase involved in cell wall biosynthesis